MGLDGNKIVEKHQSTAGRFLLAETLPKHHKISFSLVNKLLNNPNFDVYFLSTAPWDNPDAWTNKRLWIANHFDEKLIRKRLILCHHKNFLKGDILIDDKEWNGA